jgi:dienelactone hydrolase
MSFRFKKRSFIIILWVLAIFSSPVFNSTLMAKVEKPSTYHRKNKVSLPAFSTPDPPSGSWLTVEPDPQTLAEQKRPDPQEYLELNDQVWNYLAQAECPFVSWNPDFDSPTGFQTSIIELRNQLNERIGPLPDQPAGKLIEEIELYAGSHYTINWVRMESRLTGVSVFGYLARPLELFQPGPAVILLHGQYTPPHIAFGWRLSGDDVYIRDEFSQVLTGAGVDLVEAGYTVFIPWLGDDIHPASPYFPWYELDRWGAILTHKQRGDSVLGMGAYGLLIPKVMAAIDFIMQEPQVNREQVALLGWWQGAQIASVSAALDPRVSALVLLQPPLNTRQLRADPFRMRYDPAFSTLDCQFTMVELAGLYAPRPLLFSYSSQDPIYQLYEPYTSKAVYKQVERFYTLLGASTSIAISDESSLQAEVVDSPLAFLNNIYQYPARPFPSQRNIPPQPEGWTYPAVYYDLEREEIATYLAALGTLSPTPIEPDFNRVDSLREHLLQKLVGGFLLPQQRITIIQRRTVLNNPDYRLEWVRFHARFSSEVEIAGYLATPNNRREGSYPAVLSFDGNYGLDIVFGLDRSSQPYLNAYGDYLARSGYIVFAPFMPSLYADGWGAILSAKTGGAQNVWNFLLPLYLSSVDFLLAQTDVDSSRVIAYGISYAGVAALLTTAIDPRISTLIYSNPFVEADLFMAVPYSHYSPIWQTLLIDELNSVQQLLIQPRPFIWENGALDSNEFQRYDGESVDRVRSAYQMLGLSQNFTAVRHDGWHETRPWNIPIVNP